VIRTAGVLACLAGAPALAGDCRQALALGLDVSGSVDGVEYRLQLDGLARALVHPEVRAALLRMPAAPVSAAVYEWSGPRDQRLITDWRALRGPEDIDALAARLTATRRSPRDPSTALGAALDFGLDLLDRQGQCWKRTLDISGDGKSNTGPFPQAVRARARRGAITVNALVIAPDSTFGRGTRQTGIGELSCYFRAYVIEGPDAFVVTALGFEDYERAMVRKLVRELEGLALSHAAPAARDSNSQ